MLVPYWPTFIALHLSTHGITFSFPAAQLLRILVAKMADCYSDSLIIFFISNIITQSRIKSTTTLCRVSCIYTLGLVFKFCSERERDK